MAQTHNITLLQGETFTLPIRWETDCWAYAKILEIAKTAPVSITTDPHEIPDGWNVAVVDAAGLAQLNAKSNPPKASDMRKATVVSADRIEFNEISAAAYPNHTPNTGYLAWRVPHALAGYTARMQVKSDEGQVFFTLTTGAGVVIDDARKIIEIEFTDEQTSGTQWESALFDLELVSPAGRVTRLIEGSVNVRNEITTTT